MGKEHFWLYMPHDMRPTTRDSCSGARIKVLEKHWQLLQFYPTSSPLEFTAMEILRALCKTLNGNQFVLVMPNRHSKITRFVTTSNTNALYIVSHFWINRLSSMEYQPKSWIASWNASVGSLNRYELSWKRGIWQVRRTALKRMDGPKDWRRQESQEFNTIWQRISKPVTFMCSHWRMSILPQCTTPQVWRLLSWIYSNIPLV